MKRLVLSAVLGGLIAYAYGAFSWMALPWHHQTLLGFKNEIELSAVLHAGAPKAGVYLLPHASRERWESPSMLAAVRPHAIKPNDARYYLRGLFVEIVGAFGLAVLLTMLPGIGYWKRVGVIATVALIAGLLTRLPDWNWWGFSASFTLLSCADLVIGWFLAGLVIAACARPRS